MNGLLLVQSVYENALKTALSDLPSVILVFADEGESRARERSGICFHTCDFHGVHDVVWLVFLQVRKNQ